MQYTCPNCRITYPDKDGIIQFGRDTLQKEQYFPDNAFDTLYQSEEKNFWFRVRNKIIGDAITRYLPLHSRILEVGCGTGYVSRYLKKRGYHVECGDLFLDALQFCKERNAGDLYYQYNLSERIFINEFDSICAFDVLEHIDDDNSILKNLYDALKPAGILFVTVPADMRLWSAMDVFAKHKRRYTMRELRQKIEGNGFKVIKMSYFMTLLYPFILLSRKFSFQQGEMKADNAKNQIKRKAMNELHINPILNQLFFLVFSVEVPFLHLMTFPFGSSLLCIAVKEQ
jgi:2-polyprenyl-3-methyl-5-hydroxy-6-metoxy-1,4-benzoquinol methylase